MTLADISIKNKVRKFRIKLVFCQVAWKRLDSDTEYIQIITAEHYFTHIIENLQNQAHLSVAVTLLCEILGEELCLCRGTYAANTFPSLFLR